MNPSKKTPNKIFFIGIGGSGMSGLAEVLFNLGYEVSGSDIKESEVTERLEVLGINLSIGHKVTNLDDVDMVIKSTAIEGTNVELTHARKLGLPILERAELLSSLMNMKRGVAIAGTHGKTTTTSILASIMTEAMLDPTFINGGIINSFSSNAKLGTGDYMLAEADESDKSFLMLQPSLEIITNIDADHLVNYKNNMNNLEEAFIKFVKKLPFNGLLVACGDDPIIKKLVGSFSRKTILYGFEDHNDYIISNYKTESLTSEFTLSYDKGSVSRLKLNLPGKHNVLNATAASVLAIEEGVSLINVKSALEKFSGIRRRMEFLGNLGDTVVIDDYGHHPTEIRNTILTLRESFPGSEITMVFQPHRFSRTKDLYEEFVEVLQLVEGLILLEIYSAGEKPIDGISSSALLESLKDKGLKNLLLANSTKQALELINSSFFKKKEVLLIQGAGSISDISKKLMLESS
ncbi:MAG: UDP-N-acetylmuramate--L-alanine ligase [SAR86 cluster bacterium]|nr:UDP-N-acetylmuramate--L-alanine ligase [SAR86 cluster bacterium]